MGLMLQRCCDPRRLARLQQHVADYHEVGKIFGQFTDPRDLEKLGRLRDIFAAKEARKLEHFLPKTVEIGGKPLADFHSRVYLHQVRLELA